MSEYVEGTDRPFIRIIRHADNTTFDEFVLPNLSDYVVTWEPLFIRHELWPSRRVLAKLLGYRVRMELTWQVLTSAEVETLKRAYLVDTETFRLELWPQRDYPYFVDVIPQGDFALKLLKAKFIGYENLVLVFLTRDIQPPPGILATERIVGKI